MANLALQPVWDAGVYQWEIDGPVEGGAEDIDNKPTRNLGNRTEFLKAQMDAAAGGNIAGTDGFSLKMLDGKAGQVDGMGRDLFKVLGVTTVQAAIAALSARCNGTGTPNFSGLMAGDYIDGIDLSAIPAENGGTAGQAWNPTYKNNRIVLSGFNTYKGSGDYEVTKNHLLFTFRNIPLKKRMNPSNTCIGGYAASEMRAFLEGVYGDGTGDYAGSTTVTTGAFLAALKAQIGAAYILPVRRLLSDRPATGGGWNWRTCSLFLPSEHGIFGESAWGDPSYDDGLKVQFPIYQKAAACRCKRYNGARDWYWECSPASGSAAYFCHVGRLGNAGYTPASAAGGCAPDSVRCCTVGRLRPMHPTQKEVSSCGFRPANISLDMSGRTLGTCGSLCMAAELRIGGFIPAGITRHTAQTAAMMSLLRFAADAVQGIFYFVQGWIYDEYKKTRGAIPAAESRTRRKETAETFGV